MRSLEFHTPLEIRTWDPSAQSPNAQVSRVQAYSRPESKRPVIQSPKRPESKRPVVQSTSVQTMRQESSFSGMPTFMSVLASNCLILYHL